MVRGKRAGVRKQAGTKKKVVSDGSYTNHGECARANVKDGNPLAAYYRHHPANDCPARCQNPVSCLNDVFELKVLGWKCIACGYSNPGRNEKTKKETQHEAGD